MKEEILNSKKFTKKLIINFVLWSILIGYLIMFITGIIDYIGNNIINIFNLLNPFLQFVLGKSLAVVITIKMLIKDYQIYKKSLNKILKNILIFLIVVLIFNILYTSLFYWTSSLLIYFMIVNAWITYLLYIYIKKKIGKRVI